MSSGLKGTEAQLRQEWQGGAKPEQSGVKGEFGVTNARYRYKGSVVSVSEFQHEELGN